jgi:LysM repeat protein
MARKYIILLLMMTLVLAGCYRQAEDSFQPADGGGSQPSGIASPTTETLLLATETPPNEALPGITEFAPTSMNAGGEVTATLVILVLPTDTPTLRPNPTELPAVVQSTPTTLPTATPPQLITPDQGIPAQVTLPTATPTNATTSGTGLQPTPTDLSLITADADCTHTVASGENLFRISVLHDVSLQELLAANQLTEQAIIQPGQVLTVPNCIPGEVTAPTNAPIITTPGTPLPANTVLHTVASGDTLTTIARRYGISIQDIINANNLINPDRLDIGQELVIPQ